MDKREQIKKCSKCYVEMGVSCFRKSKTGKYGVDSVCKSCKSKKETENRKNGKTTHNERNKKSYIKNKDKRLEKGKVYREENKNKRKEYDKKYREENKNKISIVNKRWREENKETVKKNKRDYYLNNKEYINKYMSNYNKEYHKLNPHIRAWRSTLKESLKRLGKKKEGYSIDLLGYSALELKEHIESLFTDGMSWDNYGDWHIDHIKPVSSFDQDSNPSIVNALTNLQPLWATTREITGVIYDGNLNKGFR
jgi:hypothetical protein